MKRILSFILALCLVLSLAACGTKETAPASSPDASEASTAAQTQASSEATEPETPAETYSLIAEQTDLDKIAVSSANYSFTKGELAYFFAIVFKNYYSYLSYFGIDENVSLKEQQYSEGRTWFDVFLDEAMNYARNYLLFSEEARARGISLTQEDHEYIASEKKLLEETAAEYGWDADTYLEQMFGTNISWEILEKAMQKMLLADRGYNALYDGLKEKVTEEDVLNAYKVGRRNYDYIDYIKIDIYNAEALSDADKQEIVNAFSAAKDAASFTEAVEKFVNKTVEADKIKEAGSVKAYTEKLLGTSTLEKQSYSSSAFAEWAYSEDRSGDVYVDAEETNGARYAYLLKAAPYRDLETYVNVRHILFLTSTYGSAEAAHAEAEKYYELWKTGERSESAFASMATEFSEDGGSASDGGLYEDVPRGMMVKEFEDWCFDEKRVPGDTGIVDTSYGAHIMYFVSSGTGWYNSVSGDLLSGLYSEAFRDLSTAYPLQIDDEVIHSIAW